MQKLNIPSSFISSEQYSSMVTPNAWAALSIVYPLPNRLSGFRLSLWNARSANGTTWNYLELFGTPEGLLERREAPYPYSKMCELCELCELLERKIPPLSRWDLFYLSAAEFSGSSDEASSCAISCDFLSEPKRAARAWNTATMICHAFTFLSFFAMK